MSEKKSEKTLGLPPIELAECTKYSDRESRSSVAQKCFHPWLKKVLGTIILATVAVSVYLLFLKLLQTNGSSRKTEIYFVNSLGKPNISIANDNVRVLFHWDNKTSDSTLSRQKRKADMETDLNLDEAIIKKARTLIMEDKSPCSPDSQNEFCRNIVNKLKSISIENDDSSSLTDGDDNVKFIKKTESKEILTTDKNKIKSVSSLSSESHSKESSREEILKSKENEKNHEFQISNSESRHAQIEAANNYHPSIITKTQNINQYSAPGYGSEPHTNYDISPIPISDTCLLARLLKQNPHQLTGLYNAPVNYIPQHFPPFESFPHSSYEPHYIPHMQPSYAQSRIAVSEDHDHRPHPQDIDISMRYYTPSSTTTMKTNQTQSKEAECPAGSIPCDNGEVCLASIKWCDGIVDCIDASDEAQCTCKSRVDNARICDGYFDCPFGEDEMGCHGCTDGTFSCEDLDLNSHSTCFTKEQRCDNIVDCPNHKDELECNLLAPSLHEKPMFAVSNTEGFLQRNYKGTWFPVCNNPYMWAHDACRRETGLIIRPPFIQMMPIDPTIQVTYMNTSPGGVMEMSDTCINSTAVFVTCPDLLCGTRVLTTHQLIKQNAVFENHLFGRNKRYLLPQRRRPLFFFRNRFKRSSNYSDEDEFRGNERVPYFRKEWRDKRSESRVVGGKPSQPAAWPWMVALYRDGLFHCGGVVITQNWIVSAAHCVSQFWKHYYEIQVGMLRRFSFSPQESNHLVTHVIVNQNYNRVSMKNDLSLLRAKPAIQFSRWVRPICLPGADTAGPDWKWGPSPGSVCVAVGWGATVEHGPDPDHMREVEVPIWSQCNHEDDRAGKEICAGPVEGGKDSCQGDSGGPLLCKNPMRPHQWYMAGIVSHGDGCARKGEPGVYTRVSLFVSWMKHHIVSKNLPTIRPKRECPGFKCLSGVPKCLPKKRLCDKVIDCLNGEDEMDCKFTRNTHDSSENLFVSEKLRNAKFRMNDVGESLSNTNINKKNENVGTTIFESNRNIITTEPFRENKIETTTLSPLFNEGNMNENKINKNVFDNEIDDPVSRGDIQSLSFTISHENEFESQSAIKNTDTGQNLRDMDVAEILSDSITTESSLIETSTNEDLSKLVQIEHTTQMIGGPFSTTTESGENTELIENATDVQESKQFDVLLPFDNNNIPLVLNDRNDNSKNKSIINISKDILSPNSQPAILKKKHQKPNYFECRRIQQFIPYQLRCNHVAECEDGTDEIGCTCIDYITTFDEKLICDGIIDCHDGFDEANCYGCSDDQFLCKHGQNCIDSKFVCDGTPHCSQAEDELDCYTLSNGKNIEIEFDGRPTVSLEGFLTKKSENKWNIVCENNLTLEQEEEAANHVCRYLGFSGSNKFQVKYLNIKEELLQNAEDFGVVTQDLRNKRESARVPVHFMYRTVDEHDNTARRILIQKPQLLKEHCVPNITKTCMSLYVYCDHSLFTEFDSIDFDLEQLGAKAESQSWPWIAKVLVNGEYHCTGILIDLSWVLVEHTCIRNTLSHDFVSVVVGSQRHLKATNGPYEQIYKVNAKEEMYHSKATLLHLQNAAFYSSNVKPMVLPSFKNHNVNHRSICVAIGQNNRNETVSLYLEETEEECEPSKRCFIHRRADPLCNDPTVRPGLPWSGIISCHGVEGWHPVATFVERNGECGITTRINGTEIGNLRSYMKHYIKNIKISDSPENSVDTCGGLRCSRGRCIELKQLCDNVRDCEDGSDELEESCEKKQIICSEDPHHRGCSCKSSQLKCKNGRCISKERFGDGKDDCGDGSDEPGHVPTCAQYLARVAPLRLCDGVLHCHDKSDEDPLYCKCFSKKSKKCPTSDHCVSLDMMCDGVTDCPHGGDESSCIALKAPEGTPHGTGEVIVQSHGIWHPKCYTKPNHTRAELETICQQLGFISGHARQLQPSFPHETSTRTNIILENFEEVALNNLTSVRMRTSNTPLARAVIETSGNETCYPVFIECL